jgi:hypothetical protein
MTIVQKSDEDILDPFDGVQGQLIGGIDGHPLNFGPVLYWNVFLRLVIWGNWSWMSEFEECLGNVVQHVEGDGVFGAVPLNVDAAEKQAVPVHGDCVMFLECHLEISDVIK